MKIKGDKYLQKKFEQYQSGELSDLEKDIVDNWFEERTTGESLDIHINQIQTEQLRSWLFNKIQQRIHYQTQKNQPIKWLKIACILLLISGISIFTSRFFKENNKENRALVKVFSTAKGQNKRISLQDGTQIWMNVDSRLHIDSDFTTSNFRKVYLEYGEAFFQVKKDTLRPFKIITQNFITTVLGTSFNIKFYAELNAYKVAVASGKVKVDYLNKPLANGLTHNEVLTYNLLTKQKKISKQEVSLWSSWRSNRSIYLENMTLSQIGIALSRQYNLEVKITNPQQDKKTYTLYLENRPIQQVVRQIALQTGMSYQLTSHTLILNPNPF